MNKDVIRQALERGWQADSEWRIRLADQLQNQVEKKTPRSLSKYQIGIILRYFALAFFFFGYLFFKKTRYIFLIVTVISFISLYLRKN